MQIDLILNGLHSSMNSGNISIFTSSKSRKNTGVGTGGRGLEGEGALPSDLIRLIITGKWLGARVAPSDWNHHQGYIFKIDKSNKISHSRSYFEQLLIIIMISFSFRIKNQKLIYPKRHIKNKPTIYMNKDIKYKNYIQIYNIYNIKYASVSRNY